MGKISRLFQMLLDFANDTEEGLDFFIYLSDDSAPKTLFVPLNSGFAKNEVSEQGPSGHLRVHRTKRGAVSATSHPRSALLFQTLTGEELKLHVSSSNVVLFSFNLTAGTNITSQSGHDLHVSDLPVGNGTEQAVRLSSKADGKPHNLPPPFYFETGNTGEAC